jgi:glycosyltransferase involved in cell wall biosynthesis
MIVNISLDNRSAEICVIGRVGFEHSIGQITYAVCEMLTRSFPVCVLPTEDRRRTEDTVTLPNGREIPVCRDPSAIKVWIFVDVLWNGTYDYNYSLVPKTGLRIAYFCFDSDVFPTEWVEILNSRFDFALVMSKFLEDAALSSGVTIPIGVLPLALDLDALLALPFEDRISSKIRFLSVSAFHPRKQLDKLIHAFSKAFGDREDVELVLHSNLLSDDTFKRLKRLIDLLNASNIHLTCENLSVEAKNSLIESCDVFVNCACGEGYSIGPREALAVGKPLVLSSIGAHLPFVECPGTFMVPANRRQPARYPEIDNRVFGHQYAVDVNDLANSLKQAHDYVESGAYLETRSARRDFAANYSFSRIWPSYAEFIDINFRSYRPSARKLREVSLPPSVRLKVEKILGRHVSGLSHPSRRIVRMHDGGYFSIFNVFFSNLVWDSKEERCRMTLPDWDVSRMIERLGTDRFTSFCYGTRQDGNIWLKLYEPLFGLSEREMNDKEYLYSHAVATETDFNEHREPQLTAVNAYRLYLASDFSAWRRQYNSVFRDHIQLRSEYSKEIDDFTTSHFGERFMVAAHVRHPSHSVEQPNQTIARTESYIERIRATLVQRGIKPSDDSWGVFLATDQDRVVQQFVRAFGERVFYFEDVRRTSVSEDLAFEDLSAEEKLLSGHEVQHLVAANSAYWSTRMAWEIIRDTMAMSRCKVLHHAVSNVSTAVAYMNPDIEMAFTS